MQEQETSVGVLDRAMRILLVFSREETSLTAREIAARAHLALPTVYRLAQALSSYGLLEQDQQWLPLVRKAAARISYVQGYQENALQVGKKDASGEKKE